MDTAATAGRTVLTGADGTPVMSYVDRSRPGAPMAADARAHGPGAARAALDRLAGWTVTAADGLAEELVAGGGRPVRRAREMRRDLAGDPPPEGWADELPTPGLRLTGLGTDGEGLGELFSAFLAAFPEDHPDRRPDRSEADEFALLAALVGGRALGPVMDLSGLVVDDGDSGAVRVGAALVVNDRPDEVPWIGEVFRRPDRRYAGLGGLLLRRALGKAAEQGVPEVGLAVTEGNPAVRSYERLGFRTVGVYSTVRLPATAL
ncbi:GNAT family N-acetyltransferase [Nocardiopsis sp. RSe5-2]|uniref:GNAT family N-acetyltransferase n=1 Tax=Nocardiopsis endophytica TaxID=3018445 RepID=A0ABT4TY39_9ACTN|nr:GNAT family N-acetyltransferase [Nocardiopsis endophytica]MDA2809605.1 GNAT family N-acetyltransferase [Nocardiopsis endophytica]